MTTRRTYAQISTSIFRDNGALDVGLGAGKDNCNPPSHCIPVPINARVVENTQQKLAVATWAYKVMMARSGEDEWMGLVAFYAYMFDLVRVRTNFRVDRHDAAHMDADRMKRLDFDSEVVVIEGDVVAPGGDIPLPVLTIGGAPITYVDMPARLVEILEGAENVTMAYALLFSAGKITWWTTQHHLGPEVGADVRTANRRYYGYTEKAFQVAKATCPIFFDGWDFYEDNARTRVHRIIHPISKCEVLKRAAQPGQASDFVQTWSIVSDNASVEIKDADERWNLLDDTKKRACSFGAGARAFEDVAQALRLVITSHLVFAMPGRDNVPAFIDTYNNIVAHPYRYGLQAKYVCRPHLLANIDFTPYNVLLAAIRVFMQVKYPQSSLTKSPIIKLAFASDANHDPTWVNICRAHAARSLQGFANLGTALDILTKHVGFGTLTPLQPAEIAAFGTFGVPANSAAVNAAIAEIAAAPP